jgi:hypothetical protein
VLYLVHSLLTRGSSRLADDGLHGSTSRAGNKASLRILPAMPLLYMTSPVNVAICSAIPCENVERVVFLRFARSLRETLSV